MSSSKSLLLLPLFISLQLILAHSHEYEVGDDKGWIVPSSKNGQYYNQWASKHRFQVDDTVHFKYKKDSVVVVTETEYEKCHSPHPIFFNNNGDTEFKFDQPGLFYFISGVSGHCERGQKMIIKVLDPESLSPPGGDQNQNGTSTPPPPDQSGAGLKNAGVSRNVMLFVMSFFGLVFV